MKPVLLSLGNFHLMAYGIFVTLSYAVGILYVRSQRARLPVTGEELWNLILSIIVGALIGGRVGSLIAYSSFDAGEVLWNLVRLRGGFSFYHGFWTGVLFGYVYCRVARKDAASLADVFGVGMAFSHVPGRFGCFLAGCCFGRAADLPWAVVFPAHPSSGVPRAMQGIPVHPTQLYEMLGNLLLGVILHAVLKKWTYPGKLKAGAVFWLYVAGYALVRFVTDPLRVLDSGRVEGLLTMGQWDAAVSMTGALAFLAVTLLRRPKSAGSAG